MRILQDESKPVQGEELLPALTSADRFVSETSAYTIIIVIAKIRVAELDKTMTRERPSVLLVVSIWDDRDAQ